MSDKGREIIEPLLPQKKKTRPPVWTKRQILDGILYQLTNGCNWSDLPRDLPPYSSVFWYYQDWCEDGVLDQILTTLHSKAREQVKKKHSGQWTTLIIVDSQAVKNTCNASVESKGFCFYKRTHGIKRHLAVDILGFPLFTHCTKANISDDPRGWLKCLRKTSIISHLNRLRCLRPLSYQITAITRKNATLALEDIYPQIMTKIQFELWAKPSKAEKEAFMTIWICACCR